MDAVMHACLRSFPHLPVVPVGEGERTRRETAARRSFRRPESAHPSNLLWREVERHLLRQAV